MNKILESEIEIQEAIERYKEREIEINRSIQEKEVEERDCFESMRDYMETKSFFNSVGNALEFITASTNRVGDEIESLIGKDAYCDNLAILSNNLDDKTMRYVLAEGFNANLSIMSRDFRDDIVLQSIETMLESKTLNEALHNAMRDGISINDVKESLNAVSALMEDVGIDINSSLSIREQTIDAYFKAKDENELIKIDIVETKPLSLEITESNDGYVMATNATMEALRDNPDMERQFNSMVKNNNEIVHNEAPKETTIDKTKVGNLIQYEMFDDIGSLEKERGVKTYEEKEAEENTEKQGNQTKTTSKSKSRRDYER